MTLTRLRGSAGGVDPPPVGKRIQQREGGVAKGLGQGGSEPARRRRGRQFDHQPGQRRAGAPASHPLPGHAERQRHQRDRLPKPQAALQAVVAEETLGQGVLEAPGNQAQVRDRGGDHGRDQPPRRGRGPNQPPAHERHQQDRPGQSHPNTDAGQRLHGLGVVEDAEQVAGTLAAALAGRLEEQRRQDPQCQQRAAVGDGHGDPLQARSQPPTGIDQRRMTDQRRTGGLQDQAGGERHRHP